MMAHCILWTELKNKLYTPNLTHATCSYTVPNKKQRKLRDTSDLKQRLTAHKEGGISQNVTDAIVDQWKKRSRACTKVKEHHFEHLLK